MPMTASIGALSTFKNNANTNLRPGSHYLDVISGPSFNVGFQVLPVSGSGTTFKEIQQTPGYTLEYRVYFANLEGPGTGSGPQCIGNFNPGAQGNWYIYVNEPSHPLANRITIYFRPTSGSGNTYTFVSDLTLGTNAWTAIAMTMVNNGTNSELRLYVNGTLRDTRGSNGTGLAQSVQTFPTADIVGGQANKQFWFHPANQTPSQELYYDEVRISNVARYTGTSYSLATQPFVSDSDTQLLLHFDFDIRYPTTLYPVANRAPYITDYSSYENIVPSNVGLPGIQALTPRVF